MPIVDGLASTRMIREKEHNSTLPMSPIAAKHGHIPIIAVSASLVERDKDLYVGAGFDGWILKPIDFKRLGALLTGAVEDEVRDKDLYVPGEWERGGWFASKAARDPEH